MSTHIRAITDLIEIMNIAAILALLGDCLWVIHDISEKGMSAYMFIISLLLFSGLSLAIIGGVRYHIKLVRRLLNGDQTCVQ